MDQDTTLEAALREDELLTELIELLERRRLEVRSRIAALLNCGGE